MASHLTLPHTVYLAGFLVLISIIKPAKKKDKWTNHMRRN